MDRRELLIATAALGVAGRLGLGRLIHLLNMESGEPMANNIRISDRERAQLRGLVKTVVDGETTTEYDLHGNLLFWRYTNPDGTDYGDSYTYDASGRVLTISSRKWNGSIIEKTYHYDDKGTLLSITNSDGERTTFEYSQGRKIETRLVTKAVEHPQAAAVGLDAAFSDPDGTMTFDCYFAGEASRVKTIYDDQDQPTEMQAYSEDGRLLGHLARTFDDKGRIASVKQVFDDPLAGLPPKAREQMIAQSGHSADEVRAQMAKVFAFLRRESGKSYSYDSEGHIEQIILDTGMFGSFIRTYRYNDHADVSEEHTVTKLNPDIPVGVTFHLDENGKAIPDEPPSESLPQPDMESPDKSYTYKYDSQGNWTERTITFSNQSFTSHRELTYY